MKPTSTSSRNNNNNNNKQQPLPITPTHTTTTTITTTTATTRLTICFLMYFIASSSMLVVNKLIMTMLPAPAFVVSVQYLVTGLVVLILHKCKVISITPFPTLKEIKQYLIIPLLFSCAIFFNGKMLELANVETFLVFRFSTPLCVALIDFLLMGKDLPHARSLFAFILIIIGGISYALADEGFLLESYLWAFAYLIVICAEMIVVKHIFNTIEMSSWTRVLLNNVLSLPFQPIFIILTREWERYHTLNFNILNISVLMLSAMLGVVLAWSGTELRSLISATSFTLTGVVCKVVTVGINFVMWDRHANLIGTGSLLLCLIGATAYKPSGYREVGGLSDRIWNGMNLLCFGQLQTIELESPQMAATLHNVETSHITTNDVVKQLKKENTNNNVKDIKYHAVPTVNDVVEDNEELEG